jgi:hypothetical protein
MKRWVLLTLLLYSLCLSVVVVPLFLAFSGEGNGLLQFFYIWFVPILILNQGVLLLVPIAVVRERPVKRRNSILSAVMGAIPMAALALGFFGCIAIMFWGEEAVDNFLFAWPALIVLAIFWLFWGMVFYKNSTINDPKAFSSYLTRWLLRGSILELLVAIPSHIISRQREECCAPPFTLLGIATGLAIALLSFGPGVFFLFTQRIKAKNGKQKNT